MTKAHASACVIAGALLWGTISIFTRHLGTFGLSSLQITFCRSSVSAVLMFLFVLVRDPKLFRIRLRDCWMFVGTGIISLSFFNLCYFTTIAGSEASIAVALLYSSPIFVALLSALVFRERLTRRMLVALVLTISGCILVSGFLTSTGSLSLFYLLTGFGSGLFYALYTIFGRFALAKYNALTVVFYTFVFGAVGTAPLCHMPSMIRLVSAGAPSSVFWLVGISVFCTILPYLLYSTGLAHMENGKAAILATAELLMGSVVGIGLYHEPCTASKLLGLALIIGAVVMLNIPHKEASRTPT